MPNAKRFLPTLLLAALAISTSSAQADDSSLPRIVRKDGRYALFVDGAPYLILGAQVNNSSGWPSVLPKVWPAMELMHVNTVEIPIYWEQFEPEYGVFDYSVIDTLLDQARDEKMHLVLLWFGTWKNGSNHYMPQWMKLDPQRYPNMIGADGKFIDSPCPVVKDTLTADVQAFTTLMRHLKEADPEHTILMVQVENEAGTWDGIRDYSPAAQKLFNGPVPPEVLSAMGKTAREGVTWKDAFGKDADEFFHVWCVSKFVGQVAAAGKVVYPLPMYANASVRDPFKPGWPPRYEVGGPNDNVFPIWKAEAPALDLLAPDIYQRQTANYLKILDYFQRADNPLFVPESIGTGTYARFLFAALGRGAIGFSPFGLDYTRTFESDIDPTMTAEKAMGSTALNYSFIGPMMRDIARLNFEGKLQTAVDDRELKEALTSQPTTEPGNWRVRAPEQVLHFGNWDAQIWFKPVHWFEASETNAVAAPLLPNGRMLVAQLGENQFLVTGLYCHMGFKPAGANADKPWQYLSVEEGTYQNGQFQTTRMLNGDQTDGGMFFSANPTVIRVTLTLR
jgi:beta-galactosidase GanA